MYPSCPNAPLRAPQISKWWVGFRNMGIWCGKCCKNCGSSKSLGDIETLGLSTNRQLSINLINSVPVLIADEQSSLKQPARGILQLFLECCRLFKEFAVDDPACREPARSSKCAAGSGWITAVCIISAFDELGIGWSAFYWHLSRIKYECASCLAVGGHFKSASF